MTRGYIGFTPLPDKDRVFFWREGSEIKPLPFLGGVKIKDLVRGQDGHVPQEIDKCKIQPDGSFWVHTRVNFPPDIERQIVANLKVAVGA